MNISRQTNIILNYLLSELVPPIIRDRRWFTYIAFKLLFKEKAHIFRDFHKNVYTMTNHEFQKINAEIQDVIIQRPTDLNEKCIEMIERSIVGRTVCEIGCGRGYLVNRLAKSYHLTGIDIALDPQLTQNNENNIIFIEACAEKLPFPDNNFDTVICAHTLEHVRNIHSVLTELRRIAKKRLIIVLPCERPYYYTFNLHIHFFPYEYSVLALIGVPNAFLQKIGGDWFYMEEY